MNFYIHAMKQLIKTLTLLAAIVALAAGCHYDPYSPDDYSPRGKATYTVKMSMTGVSTTSSVHYDLMAFEYNDDGEKTGSHTITLATTGRSETYTANERSVKVKLYIKMYSDKSSYTEHHWIQQVFFLEKGGNIVVALKDSSLIGPMEP